MTVNAPKDPLHPSDKEWKLWDYCNRNHPRPPEGVILLTINEGGVLVDSRWNKSVRYWRLKPDIPDEPSPEDFIPLPK